jgi:molybdopterin/thiamine biosynthesis adenylyltransferase
MKLAVEKPAFDYGRAFSRNIGIVSNSEQQALANKRVAIPGCGGVGGIHALVLARLGVGRFRLADFDRFEIENFNRQFGAKWSSLGREKVEVIRDEILEINPQAEIEIFRDGMHAGNIAEFLRGVDVIIDSLDFFCFEARDLLFPRAQSLGIPLVTAAPLGLSSAVLVFTATSMAYQKYFDFRADDSKGDRALKFALGLSPRGLHLSYMNSDNIDLESGRGPSSSIGVTLCGALAAAESVKILLGRGQVRAVPHYAQFDAYKGVYRRGTLIAGNRNWFQRLKMWYVRKFYLARARSAPTGGK